MCGGIKFDTDEKKAIKYFLAIMGTAIGLIILVVYCSGCSSMSISKQKKTAVLIGQQIEFVGDGVLEKCNDGTISEDNCVFMAEVINQALDAQNVYTRALIAMQDGTGTQEQVQKALEAAQEEMAHLISSAISLGIKTRKENR